jgi:hypothetical protein
VAGPGFKSTRETPGELRGEWLGAESLPRSLSVASNSGSKPMKWAGKLHKAALLTSAWKKLTLTILIVVN